MVSLYRYFAPPHCLARECGSSHLFSLGTRDSAASVRNRFNGLAASSSDAEPKSRRWESEEKNGFYSTLKSLGRIEDDLQMLSIAAVLATKLRPQDVCTDRDTVGSEPNHHHCRRLVSSQVNESAT